MRWAASFGSDDSTEESHVRIKNLFQANPSTVKQRADSAGVRSPGLFGNRSGGREVPGTDQSTEGPGQAIVPEHDKLLAHTFNLDFAPATPDAVDLDRQQFPTTRRLGDVACNRQVVPRRKRG